MSIPTTQQKTKIGGMRKFGGATKSAVDDFRELASMVHLQVSKDLPFRKEDAVIDFRVRRQIPAAPAAPVGPTAPVAPVAPFAPALPAAPAAPVAPTAPVGPVAPLY